MRGIKFRAWVNEEDEEYSRMVYSPQSIVTILSHKYGKTGVARPAGFSNIDNQPKPERYVLMQYTGLTDKNGTEIYEGDIIKFYHKDNLPETAEIAEVIYYGCESYAAFDLNYKRIKHHYFDGANALACIVSTGDYDFSVIGNIYENPELLNDNQRTV